jgi:hypothetical protein
MEDEFKNKINFLDITTSKDKHNPQGKIKEKTKNYTYYHP